MSPRLTVLVLLLGSCTVGPSVSEDSRLAGGTCDAATQFTCGDQSCLDARLRCNGVPECPDGTDESLCATTTCAAGEFDCGDGTCISNQSVCDSRNDCSGGQDEATCTNQNNGCPANAFRCGDGTCIVASLICDNRADCSDFSDEQNCRLLTPPPRDCPRRDPYPCPTGALNACSDNPSGGRSCLVAGEGRDLCPPDRPFQCPRGTDFDCYSGRTIRDCERQDPFCDPFFDPFCF